MDAGYWQRWGRLALLATFVAGCGPASSDAVSKTAEERHEKLLKQIDSNPDLSAEEKLRRKAVLERRANADRGEAADAR